MSVIVCGKCAYENSSASKYCGGCGYTLPKVEIVSEDATNSSDDTKLNKNSSLIKILTFVVAFIVMFFVSKQLLSTGGNIDEEMMKIASEMNKTCPVMVDSDTRLDNTVSLLGNIFQYNYTLVNFHQNDVDVNQLKNYLQPIIINNIKTNPQMAFQKENGTTLSYQYRDKVGVFLFKIEATPEEYNN